jgi:excinuclease ABC subunit A
MPDVIKIRGARQHNLKNVDLDIPKNRLVVLTGMSGSGKSSLAFDTLYAEGQRRYVESLSSYARQFLGVMGKPDVDTIEGLSPAISMIKNSLAQSSLYGWNYYRNFDYLRLLFARGHPHCQHVARRFHPKRGSNHGSYFGLHSQRFRVQAVFSIHDFGSSCAR